MRESAGGLDASFGRLVRVIGRESTARPAEIAVVDCSVILPLERLNSVLLAGAAGDAIGGPFEHSPPDPGRDLPAPPWRGSDDTRLTLATCRGISKAGFVDPGLIASEFVVELHSGLPGVGSSTLKALRDLAAGQHWALAGARGEFAAGNGAAMRIAPLAFLGDVRDPGFSRTIRDVASITHRNDEAIAGAMAVVWALQLLGMGHPPDRVLAALAEQLPDTALSDSLGVLETLPRGASIHEAASTVGASGRTAESVALALFIGTSTTTVEEAIVEALRCGGDTDTIASIAAQLRAATGAEVPPTWLPHLPWEEARDLSRSLAGLDRAR